MQPTSHKSVQGVRAYRKANKLIIFLTRNLIFYKLIQLITHLKSNSL